MQQDTEDAALRVAVLQFAPEPRKVALNQARCDELLRSIAPGTLDLLVLPEMCFTGYVFDSVDDIEPYLESRDGRTAEWAQRTARRLRCAVFVGFAERQGDKRFNSIHVFDKDGRPLLSTPYRKHFLYETDENWADEGPAFTAFDLQLQGKSIRIVPAICMDLNPRRFEAPFDAFELARHALSEAADLVVACNAWLYIEDLEADAAAGYPSVWERLKYWAVRMKPLWGSGCSLIIANRTGTEKGVTFAGTSCALLLDEQPTAIGHLNPVEERILVMAVPTRTRDAINNASFAS